MRVARRSTDDKGNAFRSCGASNQCLSAIYQAPGARHSTQSAGKSDRIGSDGDRMGIGELEKEHTLELWILKSEWGRRRNSAAQNRNSFVAFHRQKAKKQIKHANRGNSEQK